MTRPASGHVRADVSGRTDGRQGHIGGKCGGGGQPHGEEHAAGSPALQGYRRPPGCEHAELAEEIARIPLHERPQLSRAGHTAGSGERLAERSEEHTSELQSRRDLVCRLLLEKKKKKIDTVFPLTKKKKRE